MIRVLFECSNIPVTFRELLDTVTIHSTVLELPFIPSLVRPNHDTLSMHVVIHEISLINFTGVSKIVFSFPVELSVDEVSFVMGSLKLEPPFACLLALNKVARIDYLAMVPYLSTIAVLYVIYPITVVQRSVLVNKNPFTMSFAIDPVTMIDISIGMCHLSSAIEHLIFGKTFIF